MGKVFDSLKARAGKGLTELTETLPEKAQRLQILPKVDGDHVVIADHYPADMPFFEVGEKKQRVFVSIPKVEAEPVTLKMPPVHHADVRKNVEFTHIPQPKVLLPVAPEVVVLSDPNSKHALEYRNLAEHLLGLMTAQELKTLAMIPWDQTSLSNQATANLGVALAQRTRHPILIVDATGDEATGLTSLFKMQHGQGWQEALMGMPLSHLIRQTGHAWLDIIGTGNKLAACKPSIWAQKTAPALAEVENHYRNILVAGPSFQHSPIALVLSEATDGCCLVLGQDQIHTQVETQFAEALLNHNCRVVGSVIMERK